MSKDIPSKSTRARRILAAIENPKYKSRTLAGISKETGFKSEEVKSILQTDSALKQNVMVVPGVKKAGQSLFVTVDRYKKETPVAVRILNLLKNKENSNE